jgi:hypothetical protein
MHYSLALLFMSWLIDVNHCKICIEMSERTKTGDFVELVQVACHQRELWRVKQLQETASVMGSPEVLKWHIYS